MQKFNSENSPNIKRRMRRSLSVKISPKLSRRNSIIQEIEAENNIAEFGLRRLTTFGSKEYLFYPDDNIKAFWDTFLLIWIVYSVTVLPYHIALDNTKNSPFWIYLDTSIDIFFLIDMIIVSSTAYLTKDNIIINNRKQIFKNYLKTGFFIDLITLFPYQLIESTSYPEFYSLIRLSKALRAHKLAKTFYSSFHLLGKVLNLSFTVEKLLLGLTVFVVFVHVLACIWIVAGVKSMKADNWISEYDINDPSIKSHYLSAVYFIITTIFSIGFGDIKPINDAEKAICIVIMAFGVFFFTYFISSINLILNLKTKKYSLLTHDLRVLQNIKNKYRVPTDLYKKIEKHLKYSHNNIEKYHKSFALSLSSRISQQLIFTMNKKLVEDNIFFSDKPDNFIRDIVLHLKPVKLDFGEVVCTKGEVAQEVYFVTEGKVAYFIMSVDYETIEAGDFFGDAELFHLEYREFNVKANEPSELFSLDHVILLNCLRSNEDAKASVITIAIEKYRILKKKEHAAVYKKKFYAGELDNVDEDISYKIDLSSKEENQNQMDMYIENIETS
ncbi:hypothetical protein SteCoe_6628 [Stentor coeruleus]|uniref:Cyclic nucleotide-binding domain-containing protein n=1 Tax=Stentor coeruleus TaxID=5963 RepID=A0A1R2CPR4_9CILI|nr:hypothetical protein SteCoe_6628 [Stentor coeruleus]